ncbi:hypothetical protein [Luteibacter sp. Lutesp34]|uniref:hypothetical protein n=1 Tax=Luteibacter sp. Lutesp34 TaxID=3243030 RepID=UPI0039B58987
MHRMLSLSVAVGLALAAFGALAQSRTVSTDNMPKPGVSYIKGPSPSAPVRKETVSTGSLPQPARLYVGGQVATGGGAYEERGDYGGGGVVVDNGYGGYPPGYGWNDRGRDHGRPGYGHDHDHDSSGHGHGGHSHDDDRNGSLSLAAGSGGNTSASGAGVKLAPERPPGWNEHDRDRDWNRGYYGNPPVQPGTGYTNSRAPQPGTGMGSGNQPGTGIPMRGGDGWRGR